MPSQRVSDDIKAAAVADLMAGDQPAIVAQRYGLNPETVRTWKRRFETGGATVHAPIVDPERSPIQKPTIADRQIRISELIIEVLEARLEAQLAITKHVSANDTWINKQTAADLATLDGHLHRTAVDVLDRLAGRRGSAATESESDTGSA